jgi:hypothetical protein
VFVRGEQFEGLYFLQFLDLLDGFIFFLHALDGHQLVGLDRLRHEHLGEGALALLRLEAVLVHKIELQYYYMSCLWAIKSDIDARTVLGKDLPTSSCFIVDFLIL